MSARDSITSKPPSSRPPRVVSGLVVLILLPGCAAFRSTSPPTPGGSAAGDRVLRSALVETIARRMVDPAPPFPRDVASDPIGPPRPRTDDQVNQVEAVPASPVNLETAAGANSTPSIPAPAQELPIDLPSALRLADSANPLIGEARSQIAIALANLTAARVLLLPTLNAGGNYHAHTGDLQRSTGNILSLSNQSFYVGGGAVAIGPGSVDVPAVNVSAALTDALYEPLAARQRVDASGFDASATANSVLLEVSTLYQDLHGAGALLTARRRSEADAAEVVKITAGFARTGQGRQADADRARSEQQRIRASIRRAEEEVARASSALSRRLHMDPSIRLIPSGDPLAVLSLIDPSADPEGLIVGAIRRRPEVGASTAGIAVAETRLRQEKARPFLPTLWLGASGGAFGGGSNLTPPSLGNFGGRADFDVLAYWTLENFGLGNLAIQKRRRAEVEAAVAERARVISRVREEVASSRADALAQREQITLTLDELASSERGFRQDLERARQVRGLPIELLNNLDLLIKSREDLIHAVIGFNRAQLRLFVALGSPPPLEIASTRLQASAEVAAGPNVERSTRVAASGEPGPSQDVPWALPRDAAGVLEAAHQETLQAAREYGRMQARLIEALGEGKRPASREELLAGLKALAEAHRKVVGVQAEYDRTLWSLVDTRGLPQQPAAPVQALAPPVPGSRADPR